VSAPPNIVLVTIDTLRADRVGRGLTPAIDGLAARGMRFTSARCAVPLTFPSHVSIMTGALPLSHGIHVNGTAIFTGGQPTIARVLHGGYRTGAFVGAYVLDRRFGLSDGFDVYDDRVERDRSGSQRLEAERRGDAVVDAALKWLQSQDARPFFAWIHLYDPHAPYNPGRYWRRRRTLRRRSRVRRRAGGASAGVAAVVGQGCHDGRGGRRRPRRGAWRSR
jgi:arylsulfatase A-like enzyme